MKDTTAWEMIAESVCREHKDLCPEAQADEIERQYNDYVKDMEAIYGT